MSTKRCNDENPDHLTSLQSVIINEFSNVFAYHLTIRRDFSYFSMKTLHSVRFVGGFAMAGSVTPEQYQAAKPDPIAPFAPHVMK
jgi:hypothetical protein